MLNTLKLLLPALIPSWNFFDVIAPSPRLEYAITLSPLTIPKTWTPARPRPQHVSPLTMLRRMIWNPHWNESLYLMSLSERLIHHPDGPSEQEIFARLRPDILTEDTRDKYVQFRLIFVYREGDRLESEEIYRSGAEPVASA